MTAGGDGGGVAPHHGIRSSFSLEDDPIAIGGGIVEEEDSRRKSLPARKPLLWEREESSGATLRTSHNHYYRPSRYGSVREGVPVDVLQRQRDALVSDSCGLRDRQVASGLVSHRVHFDPLGVGVVEDDDFVRNVHVPSSDRSRARFYRRNYRLEDLEGEATMSMPLHGSSVSHAPLTASVSNPPTPSAFLSSAAVATAQHLRSVISSAQSYGKSRLLAQQPSVSSSSPPAEEGDEVAMQTLLGAGGQGLPPAPKPPTLILEVPKLRDLKSHSFPPPWARESQDVDVEDRDEEDDVGEEDEEKYSDPQAEEEEDSDEEEDLEEDGRPLAGALHAGPLPADRAYCEAPTAFYPYADCADTALSAAEALNRRRRWILQSQTFSESR